VQPGMRTMIHPCTEKHHLHTLRPQGKLLHHAGAEALPVGADGMMHAADSAWRHDGAWYEAEMLTWHPRLSSPGEATTLADTDAVEEVVHVLHDPTVVRFQTLPLQPLLTAERMITMRTYARTRCVCLG
jgi:hypothetical protein